MDKPRSERAARWTAALGDRTAERGLSLDYSWTKRFCSPRPGAFTDAGGREAEPLRPSEQLFVFSYEAADGAKTDSTMGEVPNLLASGAVNLDTYVWTDELESWMPLREAREEDAIVAKALQVDAPRPPVVTRSTPPELAGSPLLSPMSEPGLVLHQ